MGSASLSYYTALGRQFRQNRLHNYSFFVEYFMNIHFKTLYIYRLCFT